MTEVVRAAGAVVWRPTPGGVEVLIVHRPRYQDWTFPKGKAEPGESDEDCARREVAEETGVVGELGPELGTLRYTDNRGRPKTVRYWALRTGRDPSTWKPGDEVDELRWLDPDGARVALTYRRDGEVLKAFLDRVAAAPPA